MDMSLETQRWQRVRALFKRCIVLDDPARARLLEDVRNEDEGLFRELRDLLELDARDDESMEPPDPESLDETLATQAVGREIGPWRLEAVLGSGGMSTVYLASRMDAQFEQYAALKLVKRGMDTDDILRRFVNERQVLADLEHPGIARLLDGGATEDGLPYLVMEHVKGTPVDRYCEDHHLDVEARLRLFLAICEPVQHAHEHGVIHRDLKPANILVTAEGHPKLLDFGIAKVLDATASWGTVDITATEVRLMTPEYASPEQVRGTPVGPPSDVYSLGVVLYELLSGHRPYALTTRLRHDVERAICELQPPRPSQAVGSAPDSRRLRARLAGDLDTIVLMALRKEPERRYATVTELGEDIERSLAGRPVLARPDTWRYRTSKFVKRNKVVVGAALGIILALTVGLVTSINFWLGEASARSKTAESLRKTRALGLATASDEVLERDTMLALLLAREAVKLDRTPEIVSRVHQTVGQVRELDVLPCGGAVVETTFSPNGDALLVTAEDAVWLWDFGATAIRLSGDGAWQRPGGFSRLGEYVLTAKSDGTARLFDRKGELLGRFEHGSDVQLFGAAFSPDRDGRYVLTAATDGTAKIWRRDDDAEPVAVLRGHTGYTGKLRVAFSPDGTRILTASEDKTACVWSFDPETGSVGPPVRLTGHEGPITCASFSPDGLSIVTASGVSRYGADLPDYTARVWDATSGKQKMLLGEPSYEVEWAAFSPTRDEILTSSNGQGGRLWDLEGKQLQEYPIPATSSILYVCSFSSDGDVVGFCGDDGNAWLFGRSGNPIVTLNGHENGILCLSFSPDGRRIATGGMDRTARLWRVLDERLPTFGGHRGPVKPAVYSPDGSKVAIASWESEARVWNEHGTSFMPLIGHTDVVRSIEFNADGDRILTSAAGDHTARIWDPEGRELQVLRHASTVATATFSPDGQHVATGCKNGSVWIWDAVDGTVREPFTFDESHTSWISSLEFAPDGRRLLVAPAFVEVFILTLEDGSIQPLGYQGFHATFTPDGNVLIACSEDDDPRALLVTDEGELLREFRGHEATVNWVASSPSGERIVTASHDGTARIWKMDGAHEATLRGHDGFVLSAVFSPEGDRVLTASGDGTARTWLVDEEELLALAAERATRDLTPAELLRYERLLDVPATEAKELVDGLFEELGSKERVLERLRRDGDVDDALRETALKFAEALSDTP